MAAWRPGVSSDTWRARGGARLQAAGRLPGGRARERRHSRDRVDDQAAASIADGQLVPRHPTGVDGRPPRDLLRDHQFAVVVLGELLEPAGHVDRVAYRGEID